MLKTILIIFIFIITITFILQNQLIFVHVFSINYDMKLFKLSDLEINNSVLMISSFVLGSLISIILIGSSLYRKSLRSNELKKKIIELENSEISKGGS